MEIPSIPQLILAAIAGSFLLNALIKFFKRERSQSVVKIFANLFIWGFILIFSLFPSFTHYLSKILGFGENLNTFIFIGFVIVFMILFKVINILERIERNISEIVRKDALEKIKD